MRRLTERCLALGWLMAFASNADGQSAIVGTVYDSLSAHGPLPRAIVVLVERSRYVTADSMGRFRIDSLPPGRYTLGLLHAVLDSFDLTAPPQSIDVADSGTTVVELATPSAASAYSQGCAVRLAAVARKADVVEYLKISAACARLARRASEQTAGFTPRDTIGIAGPTSQALPAVVVRDSVRSLSPLAMYGFEDRRRLGLGAFVTPEMMAKQHYESLPALLSTVRGVRVFFGTSGEPDVYLRGMVRPYCVPSVFLDGALFHLGGGPISSDPYSLSNRSRRLSTALRDLHSIVPPGAIKAIEVYSNPGAMPAQFDYSSSTGCGSIVIWTR
ncbi:MAG: TonB-dependent receptor [Gemmatimonadaceae bacterium]|nr:TonB-dependent receptor [Gemmatimonadaceae bacterium]